MRSGLSLKALEELIRITLEELASLDVKELSRLKREAQKYVRRIQSDRPVPLDDLVRFGEYADSEQADRIRAYADSLRVRGRGKIVNVQRAQSATSATAGVIQ